MPLATILVMVAMAHWAVRMDVTFLKLPGGPGGCFTARFRPARPATPSNTRIRRSGSCSASPCWRAAFSLRSQPARLLALGVIALTIAKVFIVDTASISGIFRALSIIGLGVVLLGIGWLYQRPLYPRALTAAAPSK